MKTPAEWHALGLACLGRGDLHEARNMFALALNGDNSNTRYMFDYGQVYVELGQFEKAQSFFGLGLEREPLSVIGNYRLANLYKQFGQMETAMPLYERAIAGDPLFAEAYNNRGGARQMLEDLSGAIADFRRAIELKPSLTQAYLNLGRLLDTEGRFEDAAAVYQTALENGLDYELFRHLQESVLGKQTPKAPLGYVRAIFDDYASVFDLHLTRSLEYTLPQEIGAAVRRWHGASERKLTVIDLGCGTGLCGAELTGLIEHLAGVDASAAMLEHADRRGIYHNLVEGDLEQYLGITPEASTDCVIAADVFIYVGELAGIFREAARVLQAGGLFIFSVESLQETGTYRLQRTGRYQHARSYLELLAGEVGLTWQETSPVNLRLERGLPVPGLLVSLVKR